MRRQLVIPDRAIPYILFQRAYLRLPVTPLYRLFNTLLPFETPLYNLAVAVQSRFWQQRTKALYEADMQNEYATLQAYLPPTCSAILDIGSGVAGIDVFIYRHYAAAPIDLYLLDKSRVDPRVYYLFKRKGAFYNSLDVAKELLTENGVPAARVHTLEATDQHAIPMEAQVNLVLSLLSWGFHYPVMTYRDRVYERLHEDGVVILDVRTGTDGLESLQQRFRQLDIISETTKSYRVAVRK